MPILPPSRYFPPAEEVAGEGFIGFGGKLTSDWLLDAYRHGIFPWPSGAYDELIPWWSPEPRAIIELDAFHASRRLQRTCRSGHFTVTRDRAFSAVIGGCATSGERAGETWLTPAMIRAYQRLFELGYAHSVEVWQNEKVVGGTYGLGFGGLFAAESMFYRVRDASKVALVHLADHLRQRGYALWDIQQLTPHTAQFGATEISRREYLRRLRDALELPVTFG